MRMAGLLRPENPVRIWQRRRVKGKKGRKRWLSSVPSCTNSAEDLSSFRA